MIKTPLLLLGIFCLIIGASVSGGSALALGVAQGDARPGLGLAALCFFDILVIYSYVMLGLEVVGLGAISGRLQWLAALITSLLGIVFGIALVTAAIALLNVMIALFLAVPFGTIVYMALYGIFDTDASRTILGMIMTIKIAGVVMIILAAPTIFSNKGLVVLTATSLAFTFGLSFLHGFVPNPLVSIVDAIAAIIFGIVATIWMVLLLIGGVFSLVRFLRGLVPA
ncbi:hypothetical protein [Methylocapsa acidiphila]|uniref:hypothetical protein n=1 Tax=Methylocapsa acidiphila TaxID=133552 RepID=UPI0003FD1FBE|nr:hypothetical protein [Methylocapsa acidiphila]